MSEAKRRHQPKTSRPNRRGTIGVEALEGRRLPALTFQFAAAVAVTGNGSVDVESNSVVNDAAGNVYLTGSLQGTADFDPGAGVSNLSSTGGRDVFVAKYTKAGALVWARDLRGADSTAVAQGGAVAVDGSGNVLIAGTFTGTVNFDPNAGNTSFSAASRNDVYIAKYDPSGALLWARDVVGTAGAIDEGYALAVDGSGNVAVAGSFQNTAAFGAFSVTAGGAFDSFVAKLSPSGTFLWAAATTGSGPSVAQSAGVTFDPSGNVIATGFFAQNVDFDPGPGTLNLPYVGSRDIFVQKLSPSGALVWAKSFGGTDIDQGNAIAADAAGNLYVTGTFSSTVNFDPSNAATNLTAGGFEDGFLLKLSPSGSLAWVKDQAETGFSAAQGTGVGLDGSGHVFVAGYYQGTLSLDPTAAGAVLHSAGSYDVFVAEYDAAGNFAVGQSAGGKDFDADFGVGVNGSGQVAIAGRYTGPATFGPTTLPAQSSKSIFLAQLASASATAPAAPNAPALQAASDSGLSSSDRVTNVTAPVFDLSGIAASGNLVQLLRDGVVVGSRTGAGAIIDPGPVPAGVHAYTARQTDSGGNVSALSASTTVTIDTRVPSTPAAPTLVAGDDSGTKGDGITNVKQPRLTGVVDPSTLAQLLDSGGNVVASTLSAADGSFVLSPAAPLADGTYAYRVREETVAGNFSASGGTFTLVIDATAPAAPATPALLAADDTGTVGDGVTSVVQPRLTGTASAGLTVQLLNASGAVLGSATAAANGTVTVAPSAPFAAGTYALRFLAVDVAGNVSPASGSFTLTINAPSVAAPSTPALLAADDTGAIGDGITLISKPRLTGTAGAGLTVQLLNASGAVLGTTTAAANGTYTVAPGLAFADGTYSLQARAVDGSGNLSALSAPFSLTIDTTAPASPTTPTLLAADDSGTGGDGVTNVTQPRLTGQAASGLTLLLLQPTGQVLGQGTTASNGTYTIAFAAPLADGVYTIRAQTVDVAGNASAASSPFSLTILTTTPVASTPALAVGDDTGTVGDGVTTIVQPHLIGTATAGAVVQLLDAGNRVVGTATAAADGSYSVQAASPLSAATYILHARATDVAGNVSPPSATLSLTIQSASGPATPSAPTLLASDDSGVASDGITNLNRPRMVGTAAVGTTVQIATSAAVLIGLATTAGDGSYTVTPSSSLSDGTYVLQAIAVDGSGTPSAPSATFALTIKTTPPAAPSAPALLAADDSGAKGDGLTNVKRPRFTGTAVAATTVQLLNLAGTVVGSATAGADGSYTVQPSSAFADGVYALQARAIDVAGNVGAAGAGTILTILTTTPPAPTPTLNPADDTGAVGDGKTAIRDPRFLGTTVPGTFVDLVDPSGIVLASTSAAQTTGNFVLQTATNLNAGTLPLRFRLRDAAGNVGQPGSAFNLTIADAAIADFEGDGKTDMAVFRPANGLWSINRSSGGANSFTLFGGANYYDIPAPGDYNGDGRADLAVFRPSTGQWIINTGSGTRVVSFGASNLFDIPVPGDYDGVGYTEPAVFRPSTAQWFVLGPTGGRLLGSFGAPNLFDIPAPGDYDGIGRTELAVFRPSTAQWFVLSPAGGRLLGTFGATNLHDIPVPGDYDGIGRTELAVFRPATAQFIVFGPSGTRLVGSFGERNLYDIPPQASIGSLRKLGTVGGIRLASAPTKSAADTIAPSAPVVYIAPLLSKKRTAHDVVSFALDSLTTGD